MTEQPTNRARAFSVARERIEAIWDGDLSYDHVLRQVVTILHEEFDRYDWVGIYVLEDGVLKLHNQRGRPTPHEEIAIGQGICGAAIRDNKTIVVNDVKKDERYLACNLETSSEIVVPIRIGPRPVAQIDIDSDSLSVFDQSDREFLEEVARRLTPLFADSVETLPPS